VAQSLTVVVASYQRAQHLATLLDSLAAALADPCGCDVDVLVLLDGSTDGSSAQLDALQPDFPVPLRYEWQPNQGLAAARNSGIAAARGELVWLLDDDMVVSREALLCHVGHHRDAARILMGPCEVKSDDPDIVHSSWWYEDRHRRLAVDGTVGDPHDASFANTSAPTSLLRQHRFDERFRGYGVEDFELALRLFAVGETIAFEQAAAITHHLSPSRSESLRKMREEGANRMRFLAMHPAFESVVFSSDPGTAERILRRVARLPASRGLWVLARCLETAASRRPTRRYRQRLLGYAERAAIYSGVSSQRSSGAR
jgi:GT2 family glycosyltransferase